MLVIVLKDPDGAINHLTHGRGDADTRKLFGLLKSTRSLIKIPIAELHEIAFVTPLEVHDRRNGDE